VKLRYTIISSILMQVMQEPHRSKYMEATFYSTFGALWSKFFENECKWTSADLPSGRFQMPSVALEPNYTLETMLCFSFLPLPHV
jgi:hypothetical protein